MTVEAGRDVEVEHLAFVTERLRVTLDDIESRVESYATEIQEHKDYSWELRSDMDHAEKVSTRQAIDQAVLTAEAAVARRSRLERLLGSPYFGRIDFQDAENDDDSTTYVGAHAIHDFRLDESLVHDWRAPVSSLFYEFEMGPAQDQSPGGTIVGDVTLKRQFRIVNGRLGLMLDTSLNIVDDILQDTLGRASDERMRTIVTTIQRDQNSIIRNQNADTLVIQGVAGSGKTSSALHRVAYLLYTFKETLSAADNLIISPNRVFADYISNVLPELGEDPVPEMSMDDLAATLLEGKFSFESFHEQNERLLVAADPDLRERIEAKSSPDFLRSIDAYAEFLEATSLAASDWRSPQGKRVSGQLIAEAWHRSHGLRPSSRVTEVVRAAEQRIGLDYNHDLTADQRKQLRSALKSMIKRPTLKQAYAGLFDWIARPDLFRPIKAGRLEHADVYPLIYLAHRLEGPATHFADVRHLLVNEMQDYTQVQYRVLAEVFACNKAILGDAHQSVSPVTSSTAASIQQVFPDAQVAELTKSYRSSHQILSFASGISPQARLEVVQRHGEEPVVIGCETEADQLAVIDTMVREFECDPAHATMGIITRTHQQAGALHDLMAARGISCHLLAPDNSTFSLGVSVSSVAMAKGLEFDRVVVPDADRGTYVSDSDRSLLYVACTRAMHHLAITYVGAPARFLPKPAKVT